MAGPSIVVRILGDLKALGNSMDGAGAKAQSTAQRAHSAFSGMLSTLNASGVLGPFSGALAALDTTFGVLVDHAKGIGTTMMGVGGGVLALGATLSAFGSKEKASHQQLQAAISATGHSYDQYATSIEGAIKKQENYGHTSAETQDALRLLTQATHDPQKAIALLGTAANVAAAKHEDLSTAAGQLGKVYNGNTRLLKEFGVVIDKNTKQTADGKTAMQALAQVTAGQASAATDTFAGKLNALKTKLEDQVSTLGQKYGPALQGVGVAVMTLGSIWEVVGPMIAAGELAALGPIALIVVGIAALIVAVYELWKHWNTVFGFIKAVVMDVWNWIQGHWPLLLGILFGPVGIAAALIIENFNTIKRVVLDVWNWIVHNWPLLLAVITGPIGIAAYLVVSNFNSIRNIASDVVAWISSGWRGLVGVFSEVSGAIGRVASDMFSPIERAFKDVVDAIAHAWNSTIGALHIDIPSWVPGIGGHGFSAPTIPSLAQGGLITSTGFVYAHAGEAISPLPKLGPSVHIENVTVTDELDLDSFMRRLAWNVQTAGV
jgi:hypothetical protein